MMKPERKENPETAPAPPAEVVRLTADELRGSPAPAPEPQPRVVKDLVTLVKALESQGIVKVIRPEIVQPVVQPSAVDVIEQRFSELGKFEELADRYAKRNPWDSFMDSKLGGEIGGAVGDIAASYAKSRIHGSELDKEIKLEQLRLERSKVERGVATAPAPSGSSDPARPTPAVSNFGGATAKLDPGAEALIRENVERMKRVEELLSRSTGAATPGTLQSPNAAPAATAERQPPHQGTAAPPAGVTPASTPTFTIYLKCGVCSETVKVEAGSPAQAGEVFSMVHGDPRHPRENKSLRGQMFDLMDGMQKGRMDKVAGLRQLAVLQEQAFAFVEAPAAAGTARRGSKKIGEVKDEVETPRRKRAGKADG